MENNKNNNCMKLIEMLYAMDRDTNLDIKEVIFRVIKNSLFYHNDDDIFDALTEIYKNENKK